MPSDFTFRLSTYLTLALACLCLGYSEWEYLPEVSVLSGVIVVGLGLPFKLKGRHELSLQAANQLGLCIGIVTLAWIAYQFVNSNSLIYFLPWPASLLPYIGALLLVLMPAKMFRPKHIGDWWAMQGLALTSVCLAASMAEAPLFTLFLILYALAAVWSVTTFYFRRTAGALTPTPQSTPGPTPEIVTAVDWDSRSFTASSRAVGWLVLAGVLALPLFFLTPRSNLPPWTLQNSIVVGLGSDQLVDLNRTGTIQESDEEVFRVHATTRSGDPVEDLSLVQYWRAFSFNRYDRGRWTRSDGGLPIVERSRTYLTTSVHDPFQPIDESHPITVPNYTGPDLGPDAIRLEFDKLQEGNQLVVFDPVTWIAGEPSPIWSVYRSGARPWFQLMDSSFRPSGMGSSRANTRYVQVAVRPVDPSLSVGFALHTRPVNAEMNPLSPVSPFQEMRSQPIREFAEEILRQRIMEGQLSSTILQRADTRFGMRLDPQDFETVARVFCDYLRSSPHFHYSLILTREVRGSDPIEDFLLRTKTGHCQRFASALTLLLRGVGIPTCYVLGHRGCESTGVGSYVIRQSTAHAWCEVLIPRTQPPGSKYPVLWHWLSLDPTPADDGGEQPEELPWWKSASDRSLTFLNDFVLGLNPERQEKAKATAMGWWAKYGGSLLLGLGSLVTIGLILRTIYSRKRVQLMKARQLTGVVWFDRMNQILRDAEVPLEIGATPRERAVTLAALLRQQAITVPVADVPHQVTEAFYLVRFAGETPSDAEVAALHVSLDLLDERLRMREPSSDSAQSNPQPA